MSEPTIERTTSTLLGALMDPADESVWRVFDGRYRPVLEAVARRMGVTPADAEDVAQETLLQFLRDYRRGKYRRDKGRLRAWIHGILRHRVGDHRRRPDLTAGARGESVLLQLPDEDAFEQLWDEECRRKILDDALRELVETTDVAATTAEAFRRYALADQPAAQVAADLGLQVRQVYLAKHRCAKALKEIVLRQTAAYDD